MKSDRLKAADGIGIVMGKPSGITEVDVDAVGDAWLSAATERFGETCPIIIATASAKAKLWYQHNGEGRHIRRTATPIDILGTGFTIAPPSWRDDLGADYRFIRGGLDDLSGFR